MVPCSGTRGHRRPLHHPQQVRAPRPARVVVVPRHLSRAIGRDLVGPVEQLRVDPVALDKTWVAPRTRLALDSGEVACRRAALRLRWPRYRTGDLCRKKSSHSSLGFPGKGYPSSLLSRGSQDDGPLGYFLGSFVFLTCLAGDLKRHCIKFDVALSLRCVFASLLGGVCVVVEPHLKKAQAIGCLSLLLSDGISSAAPVGRKNMIRRVWR
jgi:hypothetical protein